MNVYIESVAFCQEYQFEQSVYTYVSIDFYMLIYVHNYLHRINRFLYRISIGTEYLHICINSFYMLMYTWIYMLIHIHNYLHRICRFLSRISIGADPRSPHQPSAPKMQRHQRWWDNKYFSRRIGSRRFVKISEWWQNFSWCEVDMYELSD